MRILSQDGTHDFPYEKVSIEITNSKNIFAQSNIWGVDNNWIQIAKYSTKAKAKIAMKMLREKYLETSQWCSEVAYGENNYPKVFQFPSDDEIEA